MKFGVIWPFDLAIHYSKIYSGQLNMMESKTSTMKLRKALLYLLSFVLCLTASRNAFSASQQVWLSSLDTKNVWQQFGQPQADKSVGGTPISIGGRKFTRGLGTHSNSVAYVDVAGACEKFTGFVGVDDASGKNTEGTVVFEVAGDDKVLWNSGPVKAGESPVQFEVGAKGVQTLVLLVSSGGDGIDYDHAVWAEACLYMGGGDARIIIPPETQKEIDSLVRIQFGRLQSLLAGTNAPPDVSLAMNGARARSEFWIYFCDTSGYQVFRPVNWFALLNPQGKIPFAADEQFLDVTNEQRTELIEKAWRYAASLTGLQKRIDFDVDVKREIIFTRDGSNPIKSSPGRFLVRLANKKDPARYFQVLLDARGEPVSIESRLDSAATHRISLILMNLLTNGSMPPPNQDNPLLEWASFVDPSETRFELTAFSSESAQFLDTRRLGNPFDPKNDEAPGSERSITDIRNSQEYRSWCWHWWNLYGRVNGVRGNWDTATAQWEKNWVSVDSHHNLEDYNAANGKNEGDTQQLEARFFDDLELCNVALFCGHGGPVADRAQMGRGNKGWFAWGLGPHKLGKGNLRHLLLEGCGALSYFRDRYGRLLTKQWMAGGFINGVRTVCGADGVMAQNDRNGWRFFGYYNKGRSISDSWAFSLIDESLNNFPATVAYGPTLTEALTSLFDGRFSNERTVSSCSAASLWVPVTRHFELLPTRKSCVYLSNMPAASAKQDWGKLGIDMSVGGHVLTIGGEMFDRGLGTHSNSEIVFNLPPGKFALFESLIGLDSAVADRQGNPKEGGTIIFEVYVDGKMAHRSKTIRTSLRPLYLSVDVAGARQLRLVVRDAGDGITCDNADWAMARLIPFGELPGYRPSTIRQPARRPRLRQNPVRRSR
jgi:hypothetical protein